jgi:hypothetical protein
VPSTSRGLEQRNDPRPAEVEDRVELPANDRNASICHCGDPWKTESVPESTLLTPSPLTVPYPTMGIVDRPFRFALCRVSVKPIRLSRHAQDQLLFRGATAAEVEETIRMSQWHEAELGRLQCRRDFVFAGEWNGVFYRTKQIRPIFVDEPAEIIVVTVYVYYFPGERR